MNETNKAKARIRLRAIFTHGIKSETFDKAYRKTLDNGEHAGYLSYREAKPYLSEAYGEKAEEYRKK